MMEATERCATNEFSLLRNNIMAFKLSLNNIGGDHNYTITLLYKYKIYIGNLPNTSNNFNAIYPSILMWNWYDYIRLKEELT